MRYRTNIIPTAEEGIEVIGLDISSDVLNIARKKLEDSSVEVKARVELFEGGMRDFNLQRKFNFIYISFRSFLHLLTVEDQKSCLNCVKEHLTESGKLVISIFDPHLDIIAAHRGLLGKAIKKRTEFNHPKSGNRIYGWDSRGGLREFRKTREKLFKFAVEACLRIKD